MILLAIYTALAGPVEIAIEDAPLRPGRAVSVVVASTDQVPLLRVQGGTARLNAHLDGRDEWTVVPNTGSLVLVAGSVMRQFDVQPSPVATLVVPKRVDALVSDRNIEVHIGPAGLPVDAVDVSLAEGRVVDVRQDEEGVIVVLAPGESPFPRVVPIGIRDVRRDDRPTWLGLRLRARPRIPLTVAPGVTLNVTVGERNYGPFVAGSDGHVEATVDQYPGESIAHAVLTDDLGNETRSDLPLATAREMRLFGNVAGTLRPGAPPPMVFLTAWRDDGAPLPPGEPACRTPDTELVVRSLGPGEWASAMLVPSTDAPSDVRVSCTFGGAQASFRAVVPEGVPERLQLRVFPEDLRADFPEAEIRVILEDARGDRLPTTGIEVAAALGATVLDGPGGRAGHGTYDGQAAVEAGEDTLVASYRSGLGEGAVRRVAAGWERTAGKLVVFGRALDRLGRPLAGVPLAVGAGADQAGGGVTDRGGFVRAEVAEGGNGLIRVWAAGEVFRGEEVANDLARGGAHPDLPDLSATGRVEIRAGSLTGITLEVDPPLLRAAPGAVAWVYVSLEDRSGLPLSEADLEVTASEGTIGELRQRADGRWVGEFVPPAGGGVRDVVITATSEGMRSSTKVTVQPRVVRVSLGPWVGWISNFGEVSNWAVGADLDMRLRTRFVGEAVMLRVGAFGFPVASDLPSQTGSALSLRGSVVPIHGSLLLRQDLGTWAIWGGGGGAVAVHRLRLQSGETVVSDGYRSLGGPQILAGVSRRALGGEVLLELRGLWLNGPVGEVGYSGNLGGLAAGLGWRVVY